MPENANENGALPLDDPSASGGVRLSIATRIFLGFAAVVTVFGAVSAFSVWRLQAIGADIRLVSEGYLPLAKVTTQIETVHKNKQRDTDRLLEEREPRAQRILIKLARLYFPRILRERLDEGKELVAHARILAPEREHAFLQEIEAALLEVEAEFERYEIASNAFFDALEAVPAVAAGETPLSLDERAKELKRIERKIDRQLRQLGLALDRRVQELVHHTQIQERNASWAIIGSSLVAIALGVVASILAVRLLRPIRTLTEAAVRVGRGDYSEEIPTDAKDDVGVLARAFNRMSASLRAREIELREKQEALLRSDKLATVGRMATQIAHEIRNPLSAIALNTELLAEEIAGTGSEEALRLCAAIGKEVERLEEVTEQYLRFARPMETHLARDDVGVVVRDLAQFVAPELQAMGIDLRVDVPEQLPARIDEPQLRQALLNLVRNAKEAMPEGGVLTLAARTRPGGEVEIVVEDTGEGMSEEALERIFEPFFTTKKRGTGLGLSLTQQIVQQHGGRLECESAPRRGTTFRVVLPAADLLPSQ
ncbi:MAG TPA: ATP-binding protein [Fredinandcohnia sp.]|nr:ATP-binding protein [Fredinandcohnia sp.]